MYRLINTNCWYIFVNPNIKVPESELAAQLTFISYGGQYYIPYSQR